jgi:succinate dehydrogenase (ubiquinone) cytochrome b560 subunit
MIYHSRSPSFSLLYFSDQLKKKIQNYTARMKKTGRPVSPHVTIYAFPIGALSSITNRVTGCALSFGAFGLGALDMVLGSGTSLSLMQTIGSQGFLIAAPAKFAVSFCVTYHYVGAIRHFAWDYFPDYLNNVDVPKSSIALFGVPTVISAATMFL